MSPQHLRYPLLTFATFDQAVMVLRPGNSYGDPSHASEPQSERHSRGDQPLRGLQPACDSDTFSDSDVDSEMDSDVDSDADSDDSDDDSEGGGRRVTGAHCTAQAAQHAGCRPRQSCIAGQPPARPGQVRLGIGSEVACLRSPGPALRPGPGAGPAASAGSPAGGGGSPSVTVTMHAGDGGRAAGNGPAGQWAARRCVGRRREDGDRRFLFGGIEMGDSLPRGLRSTIPFRRD